MTRHVILDKDDFFELGKELKKVYMNADAVHVPKDTIPMTFNYQDEKPPLGKVNDIRIEDGRLTGEVTFFNEVDEEVFRQSDWTLGGFYSGVKYADKSKERVREATLRSATILFTDVVGGVRRKSH